ncbi:penicillin-binding protein activator [Paraferrimonas haliotis]|uniref:penicillin-binding protein activator n=1 Tax=Paraferrimonas haliotis TaxID=2013866 RepID=UPI000F79FAD6|nr:penicillin-binding protein activator [Paraferrimonas haliotis]
MTKSPMRLSKNLFLATTLSVALSIAGCSTPTPPQKPSQPQPVNLAQVSATAEQYLARAAASNDPREQYANLLLASEAYLDAGQLNEASNLLSQLQGNLPESVELNSQYRYLQAKFLQAKGENQAALQASMPPANVQLPRWQQIRLLQLQAELYGAMQQHVNELRTLSALSGLVDEAQQATLNQSIWNKLQPLPLEVISGQLAITSEPLFNGWLSLAQLIKQNAVDPSALTSQLNGWREQHPSHPAALQLPDSLQQALNTKAYQANKIAVLLPLSGRHEAQSEAIRYGIISQLMQNKPNVDVAFYDTSASVDNAYQQALTEGAEFVIGPLLKANVDKMAGIPSTVPQLYLNLPTEPSIAPDDYFFSLSPIQEAQKAAEYMHKQGIRRPLILSARSAVSKRMAEAFEQRWLELSQESIEIHFFENGSEMQAGVRNALEVDASQARIAKIKQFGDNAIQADFRSRRDIDGLFLIASASQVKLVKPFIDVNISVFADPLPIFASSRSHLKTNNGRYPSELNGLRFNDMTWLINDNADRRQANQLWPQWSLSLQRLYVMGYDAAALIDKLAQMRAFPGYRVQGQSGSLSVDEQGVLQRDLAWGRLQNGRIRPL